MGRPRMPLQQRFDKFVDKSGDCWIWTGQIGHYGYGVMGLWDGKKLKQIRTHRLSYELHRGKIPDGLCVLHRCDNPACVNPDHLFLGTQTDNLKDMRQKGRQGKNVQYPRGEDSYLARVTEKDVREIRRRYDGGERVPSILKSMALPITDDGVRRIARRQTWKHLK